MNASTLYRIASVLLVLFAVGHTAGFVQVNPQWGVDGLITAMRSIHFNVEGSNRTYWDFYLGFGFFVSVFLVFSAVLAWQLGGLPAGTRAQLRGLEWAFVICYGLVAILSLRYFFVIPMVFSIVIFLFLTAAAWLSAKPAPR